MKNSPKESLTENNQNNLGSIKPAKISKKDLDETDSEHLSELKEALMKRPPNLSCCLRYDYFYEILVLEKVRQQSVKR